MAVKKGDYGAVRILAGPYKGRVGYYDDDDGKKAIVYLGEPFNSTIAFVLTRDLEAASSNAALKKWRAMNPGLARWMGV